MHTFETIAALRAALAERKKGLLGSKSKVTVGFMPTLGYMHEGHLDLIRRARELTDIVVVSIFVNPLQFGPNEDFDRYPRDAERDSKLAEEAGVDYLFTPSLQEMYPKPLVTSVKVTDISDRLCGAARPGHFDGVATVVLKLFQIVQPDFAFFGMKDAQQIAVLQNMVQNFNIPVQIVPCPTFREADGLAMSSRNVYLNAEQRKQALVLSQTLNRLDDWANEAGMTFGKLQNLMVEHIQTAPLANIDYVSILTYPDLQELNPDQTLSSLHDTVIAALAVKFGNTRLIDNRILTVGEDK